MRSLVEIQLELLLPVTAEYRAPCFVLPEGLPCDARAREIERHERFDYAEAFPWLAEEYDAIVPVAIAFEGAAPAVGLDLRRELARDVARPPP